MAQPHRLSHTPFGNDLTVRDFGAKGDGATDDSAALQAAINAASGTKDAAANLYIPPGKYNFSRTLLVTRPIRIIGANEFYPEIEGLSSVVIGQGSQLNYTGTETAIEVRSPEFRTGGTVHRVFFEHFLLTSSTGLAAKGISFDVAEEWGVDGVEIGTAGTIAVWHGFVEGISILSGGLSVIRNYSSANNGSGIRITGANGIEIDRTNMWYSANTAFRIDHASNINITNSHVEFAPNAIFFGNTDQNSTYPITRNVTITQMHYLNGPSSPYRTQRLLRAEATDITKVLYFQNVVLDSVNVIGTTDYLVSITKGAGISLAMADIHLPNLNASSVSAGVITSDVSGVVQASMLDGNVTRKDGSRTPVSGDQAHVLEWGIHANNANGSTMVIGSPSDTSTQLKVNGALVATGKISSSGVSLLAGAIELRQVEGGINNSWKLSAPKASGTSGGDLSFAVCTGTDTCLNRPLTIKRSNGMLQFGGVTASSPGLRYSGTTLQARLADDSGDAPLTAGAISANGVMSAASGGTVPVRVAIPEKPSTPCVANSFSFDSSFWYVCVTANTWKRVAWNSWEEATAGSVAIQ